MINSMILLPTYNERENVRHIIPMIFGLLPAIRVMVVDDASPDGTADTVRELMQTFPNLTLYSHGQKAGLGRAYSDTFRKVMEVYPDVTHVITMDADLSHDVEALPRMIAVAEDYDLVIGSRYVAGGKLEGWEWHRRLLSMLGNRYCRLVTHLPIHDCTSGFNVIRISVLKQLNFSALDPSGYAFLIDLKYKLWKSGARITEYPITFRSRRSGESKISMNIIEEGLLLPWKLIRQQTAHISPSCPVCKNQNTAFWFTKNRCDMYRCFACRLIFMYPLPADTGTVYGQEYFCGASGGFGYINYDEDKEHDRATFAAYLDRIERSIGGQGQLLDVGAATGAFLACARERSWHVAGVEISKYAAETARSKGLDVKTGRLEDQPFADASFDAITLWDVFEHVPNPEQTLDRIHKLLKPGGVLALNLPDAGSVYARLMGKYWPLIIPPEHIHLYNHENLGNLLVKHGFTVILEDKIGKKYTLAYIFQILHTVRRAPIWKRISDSIRKTPCNRVSIPIHLRDNMFLIARKKD